MLGSKLNRCLWASIAGTAILITAQTTHAAVFSSGILDSTLVSWALLNNGIGGSSPLSFNSELVTFVGKVAIATVAGLMGLVLVVRTLLTRAIGTLMDS